MACIDKENLLKDLITIYAPMQEQKDILVKCIKKVNEQPTADVEEVKHGIWYHGMENGTVYAKCSACGRKMNYSCYGYARCSLCGAKMDGGEKI